MSKILKNSYLMISRTKRSKVISMFVTDKEVGLRIRLEDFIDDVIDKIGSVTFKVRNDKFKKEVIDICEELISEYKKETTKIADKIIN